MSLIFLNTPEAGHVQVLQGPVWLTVEGEPHDWVLHTGERLHLPAGARAVAGPWTAGDAVGVVFHPLRHAAREGGANAVPPSLAPSASPSQARSRPGHAAAARPSCAPGLGLACP